MTTIERTPIFSPEQIVHMHRLRQSLFVHPKNILAAAKEAQIVRPNNSPDAQLLGLKYWNEKKYTHSIPLLWTAFCQNPKKVSFLKYIVQSLHFVCNHQPHPQNTCALHLLSDILLHINPKDQETIHFTKRLSKQRTRQRNMLYVFGLFLTCLCLIWRVDLHLQEQEVTPILPTITDTPQTTPMDVTLFTY